MSGTLGSIDAQLRSRLAPRGYEQLYYFAVPGGFAVATRLERIAPDGTPARERWSSGKLASGLSLFQYLSTLIGTDRGRFRLFVIAVTNEDFRPAPFQANQADIDRWRVSGGPTLSPRRASLAAAPGTRAWLLVYEFVSDRSKRGTVVADPEGSIPFSAHARNIGIR